MDACVDGNTNTAITCLEELVPAIQTTKFWNLGHPGKLTEQTLIADSIVGELPVSTFIDHVLSEEEIIAELIKRPKSQSSMGIVAAGIIPTLLSIPIEIANIDDSQLDKSLILRRNIVTFRDWMLKQTTSGNIKAILAVLPAFTDKERERLGISVGRWLAQEPKTGLALIQPIPKAKLSEADKLNLEIFETGVRFGIWENSTHFSPIEEAVAERALTENEGAAQVLMIATQTVERELELAFPAIRELISNANQIVLDPADSLYLKRLGITKLELSLSDDDDKHISIETTLDCGFKFLIGLIPPSERPRDWIQQYSIANRITDNRTVELAIYIQAILLDLVRYQKAIGQMKKKDRRKAAKIFNPKKSTAKPLEIARHLLTKVGYNEPLVIDTRILQLANLEPVISLQSHESVEHRRHILSGDEVETFDFVDRDTGEVKRAQVVKTHCYRTKIFPLLALIWSGEPSIAHYSDIEALRFLDPVDDFSTVFLILSKVSYIGAVELAVLANL